MAEEPDLVVCTESATWEYQGLPVFVHPGQVMLRTHPYIRGHEAMFEPLTVILGEQPDVELSTATIRVVGDKQAAGAYRRSVSVTVASERAGPLGG